MGGAMKERTEESLMALGCLAVVATALSPVFWVFWGWVVMKIWGWHVVPFGIPPIGLARAVGLVALIGLLTKQDYELPNRDAGERLIRSLVYCTTAPLWALLMAYLAHRWSL